MTRNNLSRSISVHLKLLIEVKGLNKTINYFPHCFPDYYSSVEQSESGLLLPYSFSKMKGWPKKKLEQILFELLAFQLSEVKLSMIATDSSTLKKSGRSTVYSKVEQPHDLALTMFQGQSKLYRCGLCMWEIVDAKCTNPHCVDYNGVGLACVNCYERVGNDLTCTNPECELNPNH